jgi:uncharacterized integral membrane protein (TIGR00697 family)
MLFAKIPQKLYTFWMNEWIFILESLVIVAFAWGIQKWGMAALTAWVSILALVANLFVLKQINLFGLSVTASDPFVIGSLLGLNALQEYHGKETAEKASTICLIFLLFFAMAAQLHLRYLPSEFDTAHQAYAVLLAPSLRLMVASTSVFFITQRFDIFFFSYLKKMLPFVKFSVRAATSLIISQLLDTILFSFAGLYGIVESVLDIMVMSFVVKCAVIFLLTPFLRWVRGT